MKLLMYKSQGFAFYGPPGSCQSYVVTNAASLQLISVHECSCIFAVCYSSAYFLTLPNCLCAACNLYNVVSTLIAFCYFNDAKTHFTLIIAGREETKLSMMRVE